MAKYSDLLKDPRWQKMRLKILERDNFQCQDCGSKDDTLHVHHLYYEKGLSPWEYDERTLRTLCEDCHSLEHEEREQAFECFGEAAKKYLLRWEVEQLSALLDPKFENIFKDCLVEFIRGRGGR